MRSTSPIRAMQAQRIRAAAEDQEIKNATAWGEFVEAAAEAEWLVSPEIFTADSIPS